MMIFGVIFLQTVARVLGGGGEGGSLIFSYIRRRGYFFGVQNFEVQFFGFFSRKMNIFWV